MKIVYNSQTCKSHYKYAITVSELNIKKNVIICDLTLICRSTVKREFFELFDIHLSISFSLMSQYRFSGH